MGALSDISIVDFSRILAGPYATMLLADCGAEVIKIEKPLSGDDTRTWGPPFDSMGVSTYFQSVNRNKSSITADLTTPDGIQKVRHLLKRADVVVENFVPGTMESFGLGYEQLIIECPRLIYVSISGFGNSDKARNLPGYDLLVQGMSGLMSITGPDSEHPTKAGVALIDVIAGLHAALAVTTAIHHREKTGEGQKIEINLMSSALSAMVNQASSFVSAGINPSAMGNAHPSIAPYEVFRASDGALIIAVGNDRQFESLMATLNIESDSRFTTNPDRVSNRIALVNLLNSRLVEDTIANWVVRLTRANVPAGPINSVRQAIELAESLDLNPIVLLDGIRTVANPMKFSKTPVEYRSSPPKLGESD